MILEGGQQGCEHFVAHAAAADFLANEKFINEAFDAAKLDGIPERDDDIADRRFARASEIDHPVWNALKEWHQGGLALFV